MTNQKTRCAWAGKDALMINYHDHEWGVPDQDERSLFEFLILEGAQAGLSWHTVLKKRDAYRACFDHFNAKKIAAYDATKIKQLLANPGIIRNRLKIEATITNAKAYLQVKKEWRNFAEYIWHFVDGVPIQNHWTSLKQVPATSAISDALSKDLKKRGFKFIGSTICYAFMQAVGMVNDHTQDCFRYRELSKKNGVRVKHK